LHRARASDHVSLVIVLRSHYAITIDGSANVDINRDPS
jgi:hypothetical protein